MLMLQTSLESVFILNPRGMVSFPRGVMGSHNDKLGLNWLGI
jgi:hypothetical protein